MAAKKEMANINRGTQQVPESKQIFGRAKEEKTIGLVQKGEKMGTYCFRKEQKCGLSRKTKHLDWCRKEHLFGLVQKGAFIWTGPERSISLDWSRKEHWREMNKHLNRRGKHLDWARKEQAFGLVKKISQG